MKFKWQGDKVLSEVLGATKLGVERAGRVVANHAKGEKLSGQVLDVQTGTLRRSVGQEVSEDGLSTRVGTNVFYGAIHEFGSRFQPARPWLTTAFEEKKRDVEKVIGDSVRVALTGGGR